MRKNNNNHNLCWLFLSCFYSRSSSTQVAPVPRFGLIIKRSCWNVCPHRGERERETGYRRRTQFNYPHIFQLPKYTKLLNSAWQTSSKFWSPRVVYTLKSMGATTTTSWPVPKTQMRKCSRRRQGRAGRRRSTVEWLTACGKWQMVLMTNEEPVSHPVLGIFSFFGYLALDVAVVTPLDQLDWLAATPRARSTASHFSCLSACLPWMWLE